MYIHDKMLDEGVLDKDEFFTLLVAEHGVTFSKTRGDRILQKRLRSISKENIIVI